MAKYKKECFYCGEVYYEKDILWIKEDIVSHGVCEACFKMELKKIKGEY